MFIPQALCSKWVEGWMGHCGHVGYEWDAAPWAVGLCVPQGDHSAGAVQQVG